MLEYAAAYFLVGIVVNVFFLVEEWDDFVQNLKRGGVDRRDTLVGLVAAILGWPVFLYWSFIIRR